MTKATEFYGEKPGFEYPGDMVRVDAKAGVPITLPLLMTRGDNLRIRVLRGSKVISGMELRIDMTEYKGPVDGGFGPAFVHYSFQTAGKHELEFTPRSDGQFTVIANW